MQGKGGVYTAEKLEIPCQEQLFFSGGVLGILSLLLQVLWAMNPEFWQLGMFP